MNAMPTRHPVLRALAAGAVALLAITAACSQRIANGLAGPASPDASRVGEAASVDATPTTAAAQETPYFDFQVDKPVVMAPGSKGPRYPEELRAARVEGTVLAQFVVRPDGVAAPGTIKVLKTSHPKFSESVTEAITGMRFIAAEKDGRKVSQLVQQPFMFAMGDGGAKKAPDANPEPAPARDMSEVEGAMNAELARARAEGTERLFAKSFPVTAEMEQSMNAELARMRATEEQGDRDARIAPGYGGGVEFPQSLRGTGRIGEVIAMVVIDANGLADMSSFKVESSTDAAFTEAARAAFASWRYVPAKANGQTVRQVMRRAFYFAEPGSRDLLTRR